MRNQLFNLLVILTMLFSTFTAAMPVFAFDEEVNTLPPIERLGKRNPKPDTHLNNPVSGEIPRTASRKDNVFGSGGLGLGMPTAGPQEWEMELTMPMYIPGFIYTQYPGSDIVDFAVSADGMTFYVAIHTLANNKILFKGTMGGVAWTDLTSATNDRLAATTLDSCDFVAISPDNPDVVVVLDAGGVDTLIAAAASKDGGLNFYDMGTIQGSFNANAIVNAYDLDVSPISSSSIYYVAIAGTDAVGGTAAIYYYNFGAAVSAWHEAVDDFGTPVIVPNGSDPTIAWGLAGIAPDIFKAVHFSPNFGSDFSVLAVSEEANDAMRLHIFSLASHKWDTDLNLTTYPVTVDDMDATDTTFVVNSASIAMGPFFMGTDEETLVAFVGAKITTDVAPIEDGGIYRVDETGTVTVIRTTAINSIAFDSTTLVAGSYDTNNVWRCLDPMSYPEPPDALSSLSLKRIGIDDTGANDMVIVHFAGETVFGAKRGDASALSKSTTLGNTWNDFTLMDSANTVIDDISPDGSAWYMAANDWNGIEGEASVYRISSGVTQRVLCIDMVAFGNAPHFLLRGIPGDPNIIYAADKSGITTDIYASADGGVSLWSRKTTFPGTAITDMAIETADVIYIGTDNYIQKSTDQGETWGSPSAGNIATIKSLGANKLIVSSNNGYVGYSIDGGTSWGSFGYLTQVPGGGIVQVTATGLDSGDYIYAATNAQNNSIYRWQIGTSTNWEQILTLDTGFGIYGLEFNDPNLFALGTDGADSKCWWTSNPTASVPSITWQTISPASSAGLVFNRLPYALKTGNDKLWAIDTSGNYIYSCALTGQSGEVVNFPDANLEIVIREAISKPTGDIYNTDLLPITTLDGSNRNIVNLSGMEYCTSLWGLRLGENQISDITPLQNLTSLMDVGLDGNLINDISPLQNLINLWRLYLEGNQISDISPLQNLTNLTGLYLDRNQISDITLLQNLTGLTGLGLDSNQISDITLLQNLTSLTELWLGGNQISDISPLQNLAGLIWLRLGGNQINDISPLQNLTSLTWLWLGGNQINDISPLQNLTSLTGLYLDTNQISDISPLVANAGIYSGDEVDLRSNPLSYQSINIYIPQLEARGVTVHYDEPSLDVSPPTVDNFEANKTTIILGDTIRFDYSVSDTGDSGLKQVELWEGTDTDGDGQPNWPSGQTGYVDYQTLSGNNASGHFDYTPDTPPEAGIRWYGIHVVDNAGNWATEVATIMVEIIVADFYYVPFSHEGTLERNPGVDETITFTANCTVDGDSLTYTWDFGDEGDTDKASGVKATYKYNKKDNYNVTLQVTDEHGATASKTKIVSVVPSWRKDIRKGDILFDGTFVFGLLGHAGLYFGNGSTIEAQRKGVDTFSLADWDDKPHAALIRVNCSDELALQALNFAEDQLDAKYDLSWLLKSPDGDTWYCSELAWAAYLNATSIDLDHNNPWPDETGITPTSLYDNAVKEISSSLIGEQGDPAFFGDLKQLLYTIWSPVTIIVTDPDGLIVSETQQDIPNAMFAQIDLNQDGSPEKLIYIPEMKSGEYSITVIPESQAVPSDNFTITARWAGQTTVITENTLIADIPAQGYVFNPTLQPLFVTEDPANIGISSARLNGNLTSLGTVASANVSFQWGASTGVYNFETPIQTMNTSGSLYFDLDGLSSNTTYFYRMKLISDYVCYGSEKSFTTKSRSTSSSGGGGGGGGGGSSDSTSLSEYVTSEGKFVVDATAQSADQLVKILIQKDTVGKDRNGGRLRFITIKKQSQAIDPPANCQHICSTYDIGPMGATLEPFAYLTFFYNDSQVPAGVAEEDLVLATWQDGIWVMLEGCVVDPDKNTITAPITHFSVFTAMARTAPAEFEVAGLTVTPADVETGAPVNISVTVTNTGDLTGSYTVILKINTEEQTKAVTLKGDESQTVSFTVTQDSGGEYTVIIGSLSGSFTVKEPEGSVAEIPAPEPSPTPPAPPTEEPVIPAEPEPAEEPEVPAVPEIQPTPSAIVWWLIVIYAVCGIILVGLVVYLFMRRRNATE